MVYDDVNPTITSFPIETQHFRFTANEGPFGSDMPFSYPQLTQRFHLSTIGVHRIVKRMLWLPNDNGQVVVAMLWVSFESNVERCGDPSALSYFSYSMTPHTNVDPTVSSRCAASDPDRVSKPSSIQGISDLPANSYTRSP